MTTLITGATRGIGRGLLEAVVAAGEVAIGTTRRDTAPDTPPGAEWLRWNGNDPDCGAALARQLRGRPLSLLVCNAGLLLDKGQSLETGYPAAMWDEAFRVNVTAVFLTVQALLPNLRAGNAPRVAIVSSQMGSSQRAPGGTYVYRATKAAVTNLGRNLSRDLAADGIAVGMYHPGWVRTDMGGAGADIDLSESVAGLRARFAALGPATNGVFEDWRGQPVAL